jgi:hypothetical protein
MSDIRGKLLLIMDGYVGQENVRSVTATELLGIALLGELMGEDFGVQYIVLCHRLTQGNP